MNEDLEKPIKVTEKLLSDYNFTNVNPVKRTSRGRKTIKNSLQELGPGRSILVDENGNIIAGNGTTEAALDAGITRVIEIEVPDRHTVIAVKKGDMDDTEKDRMAMLDNASAKMAIWDGENLAKIFNRGVPSEGIFTEKELDKIMANSAGLGSTPDIPKDMGVSLETSYYVVIQYEEQNERDEMFESLEDSGLKVFRYESKK